MLYLEISSQACFSLQDTLINREVTSSGYQILLSWNRTMIGFVLKRDEKKNAHHSCVENSNPVIVLETSPPLKITSPPPPKQVSRESYLLRSFTYQSISSIHFIFPAVHKTRWPWIIIIDQFPWMAFGLDWFSYSRKC